MAKNRRFNIVACLVRLPFRQLLPIGSCGIAGVLIWLLVSARYQGPVSAWLPVCLLVGVGGIGVRQVVRLSSALEEMERELLRKQHRLNIEKSRHQNRKRELEEKIRISERKYQAIFKDIPNPLFILDRAGFEILDCNDAGLEAYGYRIEELKGRSFMILFPGLSAFAPVKNAPNQPFHERLVTIKKDEDYLYVSLWVRPADFDGKEVLIVTAMDITESIETEHQLVQAGKMATLGEMATGVAHELNQPLSVIKTASGFISRKIANDQDIDRNILKTLADEIESHVDRASKITNHMRLFGRKSEFQKEPVDINDVLKRAFDIFSQQLKLREIDVIWKLAKGLPRISADPVRLEQVFINLLINARDAIVEKVERNKLHGKPAGSWPVDERREITLVTREENGRILVKIRDSGTGIASTNMDKVFEPFFTTKKVGQGTGLGLSISYGIIRESGGKISAHNNKDGGATFVMLFNIKEEDSA